MENKYTVVTSASRQELRDGNYDLARVVWPQFMLHDPTAAYFHELYTEPALAKFQFALIDPDSEETILMANSIPLFWDGDIKALPDEGWDWGVEKGVRDLQAGRRANMLMAIQIMTPPAHRGRGLSTIGVQTMKDLARQAGLDCLIAPVRPNRKSDYPLTSFDRYIYWRNGDGLPFDPWIRVHARLGATIIKPCHHSMEITGTVAEWEDWTKKAFPESGRYVVPGALEPIEINLENDSGVYIEPNVWIHHPDL